METKEQFLEWLGTQDRECPGCLHLSPNNDCMNGEGKFCPSVLDELRRHGLLKEDDAKEPVPAPEPRDLFSRGDRRFLYSLLSMVFLGSGSWSWDSGEDGDAKDAIRIADNMLEAEGKGNE